jgi:hypothetical protein
LKKFFVPARLSRQKWILVVVVRIRTFVAVVAVDVDQLRVDGTRAAGNVGRLASSLRLDFAHSVRAGHRFDDASASHERENAKKAKHRNRNRQTGCCDCERHRQRAFVEFQSYVDSIFRKISIFWSIEFCLKWLNCTNQKLR